MRTTGIIIELSHMKLYGKGRKSDKDSEEHI